MTQRVLPAQVQYASGAGAGAERPVARTRCPAGRAFWIAEFAFRDRVDEAAYVTAYRRCGRYDLRQHQIALIERLGRDFSDIVPRRFIHAALKLAKTPARLAGLGELHRFLESGFSAFRHMGRDAETFVATIAGRERAILEQIRAGHPRPLELAGVSARRLTLFCGERIDERALRRVDRRLKDFIQLAMDFLFQLVLERRQQKTQPDADADHARLQIDLTADAGALEIERVLLPVITDFVAVGELFGEGFRRLARLGRA